TAREPMHHVAHPADNAHQTRPNRKRSVHLRWKNFELAPCGMSPWKELSSHTSVDDGDPLGRGGVLPCEVAAFDDWDVHSSEIGGCDHPRHGIRWLRHP